MPSAKATNERVSGSSMFAASVRASSVSAAPVARSHCTKAIALAKLSALIVSGVGGPLRRASSGSYQCRPSL